MLINIEELKELYPEFKTYSDKLLARKLEAIENAIRSYTNNPFQNRAIRETCYSEGKKLISIKGTHLFKVNDTVQINVEAINKGLYVVETVGNGYIEVDKELYDSTQNLVTKVEYPLDVVDGAINILKWDIFNRDKVGIASETISRHSISYQQYDGTNTINGYPSMLFGFCKSYMMMRT